MTCPKGNRYSKKSQYGLFGNYQESQKIFIFPPHPIEPKKGNSSLYHRLGNFNITVLFKDTSVDLRISDLIETYLMPPTLLDFSIEFKMIFVGFVNRIRKCYIEVLLIFIGADNPTN